MTNSKRRLGYRADVDGMRAVAVVAVLLFHADLGLPGGFVGVDVFFVISGFLITSIVMREIELGIFSYLNFWGRRARRLIPAMSVVVVTTILLGYFILLPNDFRELGQSVCAQAFAAANVYFYRESGYFAGASEVKPLLHTWSLAVEEQFYFLMPGLLVVVHRLAPRRILIVLVALLLVSLGWCVRSSPISRDAAFYLLPARGWEMLLGGVVALLPDFTWIKRPVAELLGWAGLVMVVTSTLLYQSDIPFPGVWAMLPCFGTVAMIIGHSACSTMTSKMLSWRPLVFIGLISYSLYLWHWPLFAFANYLTPGDLPSWVAISLLAASFALAVLSWKFVETPFREKSLMPTRASILGGASIALLTLAGMGAFLHLSDGVRFRFNGEVLRFADGRLDRNSDRRLHHDLSVKALADEPKLLSGTVGQTPQLIVVGDSHGDAIIPGIVGLCSKRDVPMVAFTRSDTMPVCYTKRPRTEGERIFYESVRDYINRSPAKDVMLVARWSGYGDRLSQRNLVETIVGLRDAGKRIWIVKQVPEPVTDAPRYLALNASWGLSDLPIRRSKQDFDDQHAHVNQLLESVATNGVTVVDISAKFFESSDLAVVQESGFALFFDDNHLSTKGATFAATHLDPVIAVIASSTR